jgi:hypothetical protein
MKLKAYTNLLIFCGYHSHGLQYLDDDDDEPHPLPCYSADEETLAPVTEMPWVTEKKRRIQQRNEVRKLLLLCLIFSLNFDK